MILGRGLYLTFIGLTVGFLAAIICTKLLAAYLFGVTSTDPATFTAVALLFSLVVSAACFRPARRAMLVDPMEALRYE
jgi:putative ABC transport system permease protein